MGISARRYRADRQGIMDKGKIKAKYRQIVYNLSESKKTEFASIGSFVLIIVNCILLLLFPLSRIVANLLIALRQGNKWTFRRVVIKRTAWTLSLTRLHLPQTSHNVLNYIIWIRWLTRSNIG